MTQTLRHTISVLAVLCCLGITASAQAVFPGIETGPLPSLDQIQATPAPNAAGSQWTTATAMPEAKTWHAVAEYDGKVYTFGGYILSGNNYAIDASSYVYDPVADTWSSIADFPAPSYVYAHAFAVNDKIYILGGVVAGASMYEGQADVYEYDPATDTYTTKTSMPTVQCYSSAGVIDNKIYLISGRSNTAYNSDVQVYDPATDTWSTATNYPMTLINTGAATVDNKIVVVGGYSPATQGTYRSVYVGSVENDTLVWTQVESYPLGFMRYSCGAGLNGMAFFTGGDNINTGLSAVEWTYGFDMTTLTWKMFEKKPTGIYDSRIVGVNDVIVAAGGRAIGGYPLAVTEILDPAADAAIGSTISPSRILLTVTSDDDQPRSKSVTIASDGVPAVTWSAAVDGDVPWLSMDITSGSVQEYGDEEMLVSADPTQMQAGKNTGHIIITTDDPNNQSFDIEVIAYKESGVIDETKRVLIEEFSGTWCGYCPYGADSLDALEQEFGDQLSIISYHQGSNDPMQNNQGLAVISYLGVGSYPSAAIDRRWLEGETRIPISRGGWGNTIREILATEASGVKLELTNKTYDEDTKEMTLTAEITFLQAVEGDFRFVLVQTNSQKNVGQIYYASTGTQLLYPYYHNHVEMQMVPNADGAQLGDGGIIEPMTKFSADITFTSLDSLTAHSDLTAFVYQRGEEMSGHVFQSLSENVLDNVTSAQPPALAGTFALQQNFPNPFNPSTVISYNMPYTSHVKLVVTDVLGREVSTLYDGMQNEGLHTMVFDGRKLQSGTYFITMQSGDFVQTRSMTLMK